MYPEIYNSSGDRLCILDNITRNSLKKRVNGLYKFNFVAFEKEFKSEYIQFDNVVRVEQDSFDIAYIDQGHDINNKVEYKVECEHVFYRLIDEELNNYANTGAPTAILNDLLSGTDFTVGTVDFTEEVVFAVNRNANKMNIIISLANTLGAEIGFSDDGFTIDLLNTIGQENGYQVRIKKNLKTINKTVDRRGDEKTTYRFDVVNIFKSDDLVNGGLEDLEVLGIGDTLQLIDETLNIDVSQSVYEIEKDVVKDKALKVTTGNNFDNITDEFALLQETAIKQGDIIYGVKINSDVGIEIERDDQLSRVRINSDEFRMQVGDGVGGYTDALYFDPINERFIFIGKIEATEIVGGSISGATAEFGNNGKIILTPSTNGSIQFEDSLENLIASIESNALFDSVNFFTESGVRLDLTAESANVRVRSIFSGDVEIFTSSSNTVEIQRSSGGDATYKGFEIVNNNGDGLNKTNSTLSVDDTVARTNSQDIKFQVSGGNLEYSLNGGAYTALQNL